MSQGILHPNETEVGWLFGIEKSSKIYIPLWSRILTSRSQVNLPPSISAWGRSAKSGDNFYCHDWSRGQRVEGDTTSIWRLEARDCVK